MAAEEVQVETDTLDGDGADEHQSLEVGRGSEEERRRLRRVEYVRRLRLRRGSRDDVEVEGQAAHDVSIPTSSGWMELQQERDLQKQLLREQELQTQRLQEGRETTSALPTLACVAAFDRGGDATCVVRMDNSIKCWGYNGAGRLGLGDVEIRGPKEGDVGRGWGDLLPPVDLGNNSVRQLVMGAYGTCVLTDEDLVKCWGDAATTGLEWNAGNVGDEPFEMGDTLQPVDLGHDQMPVLLAAGGGSTCAVLSDGALKCWGLNGFGQLGYGDTVFRGPGRFTMGDNLTAIELPGNRTVHTLAVGKWHTCAVLEGDGVTCWGANRFGGLGYVTNGTPWGDEPGEMGDMLPMVDLGLNKVPHRISVGWQHSCVSFTDGTAKCWGENDDGQLGQADRTNRFAPEHMGDNLPSINLGEGRRIQDISCGKRHTCVLLDGGEVKCFGYGTAMGDEVGENIGVSAEQMGDFLQSLDFGSGRSAVQLVVDHGSSASCVVLDDATLKCWGINLWGSLGYTGCGGRCENSMGDYLPAVPFGCGVQGEPTPNPVPTPAPTPPSVWPSLGELGPLLYVLVAVGLVCIFGVILWLTLCRGEAEAVVQLAHEARGPEAGVQLA